MVPYGDGTGPAGLGPGTGQGRGRCGNGNPQNSGGDGWRNLLFHIFRRPKSESVLSPQKQIPNQRTAFALVDASRCTHCGICAEVCPVSAIAIEDNGTIINNQTCIGCGQCVRTCPKDAIRLMEH